MFQKKEKMTTVSLVSETHISLLLVSTSEPRTNKCYLPI